MAIVYEVIDVPFPKIQRGDVNRWIKEIVYAYHDKKLGVISFVFCSDDEILRINNLYLHHDYYTDIITFDYSQGKTVSGDLFISLDTVKSNSEKYETDYYDELRRVMIHGILHLCGFNDKTFAERQTMRQKEDEALTVWNLSMM
ncbi:MAG: rRNA maturation RNase YbeY [Candidatus Azobacteroides sp.]|nr:rRNA maturation RNase YbeY [Candidatus Azobacteroides sp.]